MAAEVNIQMFIYSTRTS